MVEKQGDGPRPAEDEIRASLQNLLTSKDFTASVRNRRFLSYVVEETLNGRGSRIKAYSIALAAFDRNEDFDPLTDPIVRIEASRLRRSLEHYYLTGGKTDPIRIDIPKGSYVAVFSRAMPAEMRSVDGRADDVPLINQEISPATMLPPRTLPSTPPSRSLASRMADKRRLGFAVAALIVAVGIWVGIQQFWSLGGVSDLSDTLPRGPKIIVYPFDEISDGATQALVSRGMTYDIIGHLTRFNDLFVYGPETSFYIGNARKQSRTEPGIQADFALTGRVLVARGSARVSATLADLRTGQNVWGWSNEVPLTPSDLREAQTEIAEHVARAVAQPYGTVFERGAREISGKPASDLLSYECVVRFQEYWRTYDARMYDDLVGCMKATIDRDPGYARAYSCLALLYIDAHRFGYGTAKLTFDPVQRALELADTAIELEPMASDGYLALSVARWFDHDLEGGLQAARHGLDLNPNNTILIGELGIRYALLARWGESKPLIDKFFALNPNGPAGYRRGNFLYAYMHSDYQSALAELMAAEMPLNIYDYVFRAMTYAQLGDRERAEAAVSQVLMLDPKYGEHVVADFRKRNTDPSIIRAIVDGLAKAELPLLPTRESN